MKAFFVGLVLLVGINSTIAQETAARSVNVNGAEFHYLEKGRGEAVVFLHGAVGDMDAWSPQLNEFAKDYRVISYSRRLHYPNRNPLPRERFSVRTEADDLMAFLKAMKIRKAHLVGASIGAYVALVFAMKHADMVSSLVLAEPPVHDLVRGLEGGQEIFDEFRHELDDASKAFRNGDDRGGMAAFAVSMGRPLASLSPEAAGRLTRNTAGVKAVVIADDAFRPVDTNRLKKLRVPILVVTGENTVTIHKLVNKRLLEILPNAVEVTIPKAGHAMYRENSTAFNESVRQFLTGRRGRTQSNDQTTRFARTQNQVRHLHRTPLL